MITVKEKLRLVESCFGNAKIGSDNVNIAVECPCCSTKKKVKKRKLSIDLNTGIYHCWVCESKGKNIGRLALKYSIQKKAASQLYSYFKTDKDDEQIRIEEKEVIKLPEDFRLIAASRGHEAKIARAYLENRGFDEKAIWRFRAGISNRYKYKNRIIFPSFDKNQNLNFFLGRSFLKEEKLKYRNCSAKRKDVIFKELDIDFSKTLFIAEGVFDLLNMPNNSTCLLGSWMDKNYAIFNKIVENKTPVVLCLDPDASDKAQKIAKNLHEYCIDVKICRHRNKDFGDMTKNEINYWINNAKPYNNLSRIEYLIKGISSGSMF